MNKEKFIEYLKNPGALDKESISDLSLFLNDFPYSQTAQMLLLKGMHNQGSLKYDEQLKLTAAYVTDRKILFDLINKTPALDVKTAVEEKVDVSDKKGEKAVSGIDVPEEKDTLLSENNESNKISEEEKRAEIERERERIQEEERIRIEEDERIAAEESGRQAEKERRIELERLQEEEALRLAEEERIAAEQMRKRAEAEQERERQRLYEEEKVRLAEAERVALEEARKREEEAIRKAEEERIAAEQLRKQAEAEQEIERQRLYEEEKARLAEAERAAAEEARKIEEETVRKAEEERIAAEQMQKQAEAEQERQRLYEEEKVRQAEAERAAAEEARKREEEALRLAEEERIAAEQMQKQAEAEQEKQRLSENEKVRLSEAERVAVEEARNDEQQRHAQAKRESEPAQDNTPKTLADEILAKVNSITSTQKEFREKQTASAADLILEKLRKQRSESDNEIEDKRIPEKTVHESEPQEDLFTENEPTEGKASESETVEIQIDIPKVEERDDLSPEASSAHTEIPLLEDVFFRVTGKREFDHFDLEQIDSEEAKEERIEVVVPEIEIIQSISQPLKEKEFLSESEYSQFEVTIDFESLLIDSPAEEKIETAREEVPVVSEPSDQIPSDEGEVKTFSDWLLSMGSPDVSKGVTKSESKKEWNLIENFLKTEPVINTDLDLEYNYYDISKQSVKQDDSFITETLAKIYVKQKNYERAINAYEKLCLKYPEKSTYFASQIEKLKEKNK